jgi:SAM-dependent methyltransferase
VRKDAQKPGRDGTIKFKPYNAKYSSLTMISRDPNVSCYDEHARAYDAYQMAVVPRYRDMLEMVAEACRRYLGPSPRILALGCGTGNAAAALLEKTDARVFLLDGSAGLVELARAKISRQATDALLGYRVADLCSSWEQGLGGFDAVLSTLVLEHLPFPCYRETVKKCFQILRPDGWLLAVEGYEEPGSDMQEWFNSQMEARRKEADIELSDFVAALRETKEVHYFTSKEEKAAWWREAGFLQVTVLWQYLCIALMVGMKPL